MRLKRLLLFMAVMAAVIMTLKLLNWVPVSMRGEGLNRYSTVDDARTTLKLKKIYLPVYFPQYLKWPPREIYAQKKPFAMVLMHFSGRDSDDIVLSIRESESGHLEFLKSRIEPEEVTGEEKITLKGRPAVLVHGICPGKEPCNSVTWRDGGYDFTVIMKDSSKELLRVSESMLSE
jgi:hypothetical protein